MAIYTRKDAHGKPRYTVRIESKDPLTGARKRINVGTFATKREAAKAELDALSHRERGTLVEPDTLTVAELLDQWLATKAGEVSSNSLKDYEIIVRRHLKPAFGSVRVQALRADRVQAQYTVWRDAGMSPRMIRGCHMRLSQALDYAVRLGLVSANVAKAVTPPRLTTKKPAVWTAPQAAQFLDAAKDDSLWPLWPLLALEGMRRGEALGLRWQDINWGAGVAVIVQTVAADKSNRGAAIILPRTKTAASARTVRLTETTLSALREHRKVQLERRLAASSWEDNDLIIATASGRPVGPANITRSFRRLVQKAGLPPIRVHDLRHSAATMLLTSGVPAKVVSERLGHASVGITLDIYSHVLPDMQDEAAAAVDRLLARARQGAS